MQISFLSFSESNKLSNTSAIILPTLRKSSLLKPLEVVAGVPNRNPEVILGGFGSSIIEHLNKKNKKNKVITLGIPDKFIGQATREELLEELKLDSNGIYNTIINMVKNNEEKNI